MIVFPLTKVKETTGHNVGHTRDKNGTSPYPCSITLRIITLFDQQSKHLINNVFQHHSPDYQHLTPNCPDTCPR